MFVSDPLFFFMVLHFLFLGKVFNYLVFFNDLQRNIHRVQFIKLLVQPFLYSHQFDKVNNIELTLLHLAAEFST